MRKILLIFVAVTAALVCIWAAAAGVRAGFGKQQGRTNPEQKGTPRVYDYADMLTASQEKALEKKIAATEPEISADIVVVILDESLEKKYPDLVYLKSDESDAYKGIRRYAESFWTEKGFGWNAAGDTGNGIIMVDNIYRESNGWVYNWVAGAGDLRYSVGDQSCADLSGAFTARLPQGDMPRYDQAYADALMEYISDCGSFGNKIRSMLGWRIFTPDGILMMVTSSTIALIAVVIALSVLFSFMTWHLRYNGKQKKSRRKKAAAGGSGFSIAVTLLILLSLATPFAVLVILFLVWQGVRENGLFRNKAEGKADAEKRGDKPPFSVRQVLKPCRFHVTESQDTLVKHYTTTYTASSGGDGGGFSGGGSFSGGGGGGGFSGGGSHR